MLSNIDSSHLSRLFGLETYSEGFGSACEAVCCGGDEGWFLYSSGLKLKIMSIAKSDPITAYIFCFSFLQRVDSQILL